METQLPREQFSMKQYIRARETDFGKVGGAPKKKKKTWTSEAKPLQIFWGGGGRPGESMFPEGRAKYLEFRFRLRDLSQIIQEEIENQILFLIYRWVFCCCF